MSVQKALAFDPSMHRGAQGTGWLAGAVAFLDTVRARHASVQAARREAQSRAEVMSLARRYASTQPEFAKDLYAAAGCDFQL